MAQGTGGVGSGSRPQIFYGSDRPLTIYLPLELPKRPGLCTTIRSSGGVVDTRLAKCDIVVLDTESYAHANQTRQLFRSARDLPKPLPCVSVSWLVDSARAGVLQNVHNTAYDPIAQLEELEKKELRKQQTAALNDLRQAEMMRSEAARNPNAPAIHAHVKLGGKLPYTALDIHNIVEQLAVTKATHCGRKIADELVSIYGRHSRDSYQSFLRDNLDKGHKIRSLLAKYQRTKVNPVVLPPSLRLDAANGNTFRNVGEELRPRLKMAAAPAPSHPEDFEVSEDEKGNQRHGSVERDIASSIHLTGRSRPHPINPVKYHPHGVRDALIDQAREPAEAPMREESAPLDEDEEGTQRARPAREEVNLPEDRDPNTVQTPVPISANGPGQPRGRATSPLHPVARPSASPEGTPQRHGAESTSADRDTDDLEEEDDALAQGIDSLRDPLTKYVTHTLQRLYDNNDIVPTGQEEQAVAAATMLESLTEFRDDSKLWQDMSEATSMTIEALTHHFWRNVLNYVSLANLDLFLQQHDPQQRSEQGDHAAFASTSQSLSEETDLTPEKLQTMLSTTLAHYHQEAMSNSDPEEDDPDTDRGRNASAHELVQEVHGSGDESAEDQSDISREHDASEERLAADIDPVSSVENDQLGERGPSQEVDEHTQEEPDSVLQDPSQDEISKKSHGRTDRRGAQSVSPPPFTLARRSSSAVAAGRAASDGSRSAASSSTSISNAYQSTHSHLPAQGYINSPIRSHTEHFRPDADLASRSQRAVHHDHKRSLSRSVRSESGSPSESIGASRSKRPGPAQNTSHTTAPSRREERRLLEADRHSRFDQLHRAVRDRVVKSETSGENLPPRRHGNPYFDIEQGVSASSKPTVLHRLEPQTEDPRVRGSERSRRLVHDLEPTMHSRRATEIPRPYDNSLLSRPAQNTRERKHRRRHNYRTDGEGSDIMDLDSAISNEQRRRSRLKRLGALTDREDWGDEEKEEKYYDHDDSGRTHSGDVSIGIPLVPSHDRLPFHDFSRVQSSEDSGSEAAETSLRSRRNHFDGDSLHNFRQPHGGNLQRVRSISSRSRNSNHSRQAISHSEDRSSTTLHRSNGSFSETKAKKRLHEQYRQLAQEFGFIKTSQLQSFVAGASVDVEITRRRLKRHFDGIAEDYGVSRDVVIQFVRAAKGSFAQADVFLAALAQSKSHGRERRIQQRDIGIPSGKRLYAQSSSDEERSSSSMSYGRRTKRPRLVS